MDIKCPTAHYVSDFVLSVHLWQCLPLQEVLLRQRCFRWKQQVIWLEEIPVTCRASEQLCNSTPHPNPVCLKCWSLRDLISLGICCSDWLGACPLLLSPNAPCRAQGQGHCLPQLMGTKSPLLTVKQRGEKKPHPHGQEELWLAWKCCVQQPHHHNLDKQSWSTDKPSGTRSCLGPWANFWVPIASG